MNRTPRIVLQRAVRSRFTCVAGLIVSLTCLGFAIRSMRPRAHGAALYYQTHLTATPASARIGSSPWRSSTAGTAQDRDFTSMQVEMWNAGDRPIRPNDFGQGIRVKSSPRAPIVEAQLLETTAPEIGLIMDVTKAAEGSVTIDWGRLAPGERVSFRLACAKPGGVDLALTGKSAGDARITRKLSANSGGGESSARSGLIETVRGPRFWVALCSLLTLAFTGGLFMACRLPKRRR
jgi:hypothetical protein